MIQEQIIVEVRELAKHTIGLAAESLGDSMFHQCINTRCKALKLDLANYQQLLKDSAQERDEICQMLLVSESWFMRDMEPVYCALNRLKRQRDSIAILSVPCARGEEPISALIAALESGFAADQVFIEGYDLSTTAISQAKTYCFGEYSFRGADNSFKACYFERSANTYKLNTKLCSSIYYACANLTRPGWCHQRTEYDLILCRNLLIYLAEEERHKLIELLQFLLASDGTLIVSSSEGSLVTTPYLAPLETSAMSFCRRQPAKTTPISTKISVPQITRRAKYQPSVARATIPCDPLANAIQRVKELADQNQLTQAFSMGLELLENYPTEAELHFILGVVALNSGDSVQAKQWIEQALKINPSLEDAQIYLNNLQGAGEWN